jgi:hypothetical protein
VTYYFCFCSPSEIQTAFLLAQNVALRRMRNHTHSDVCPGFRHAENLVTVPSPQTHLYSETLTPRPNNCSLSEPCKRKRLACRRAAWPRTTTIPMPMLLLLQTHAVHTAFSLPTLYILLSPATSMELQRKDIVKCAQHASLPACPRLCAESHFLALLCV